MAGKQNLFEYLAISIAEFGAASLTGITEVDQDQYDAPPDDLILMTPTYDTPGLDDSTAITAASETYDNDKSITPLNFPSNFIDETSITKVNGDTYDDQSMTLLAVPLS